MARILTTLHLSDIQKEVLAKTKAAPNPQLAWEEVTGAKEATDDNFAAARDTLGNLGLLTVGDGTLEVTDKGLEVMKDAGLTDETGELTDEGQQLAAGDQEQPAMPPPDEGGEMDMGMGDELSFESLSLLQTIHEDANANEHMRRVTESEVTFTPQEIALLAAAADGNVEAENALDRNIDIFYKIQDFVVDYDPTWMPYGTQKARDDDPVNWIYDHLEEIVQAIRQEAKTANAVNAKVGARGPY